MEYLVKREHFGDKMYYEGDTREAEPRDVQQLVDRKILVVREEAPQNKATKPPKTKGE